jgi:hypothetical protein
MSKISLKIASICAGLSAITTFLLWLLPRFYTAGGFEQALALHNNPYYIGRLWVNFIHIFLALTAYAAAANLWRRYSPALAGMGLLWFVLWGFTELLGVTTNIFAVNGSWRAQFAQATPDVQNQLRVLIIGFQGVWNALFFLLLIAFLLGTLFFGLAAIRGQRLERWLGWLFLLAVPLTIVIILDGYAGFSLQSSVIDRVYPMLQPISRGLLAYWLWTESRSYK